jgi:endonuclease-3
MQLGFGFGAVEDLTWVRGRLRFHFGDAGPIARRSPVGQLIKSLISSRTRDEISLAAYHRLVEGHPAWSDLAVAASGDIETAIGDVTFADVKARQLGMALRAIAVDHPDFDLDFLAERGVSRALSWLEVLPGVGRKVAASTLNFSTLAMPAFVIDTHVLRILRRYGFVRRNADLATAYHAVMEMADAWTAIDLAELHIWMKRLGQSICRFDRACCDRCPIRQRCISACAATARYRA